MAHTGQASRPLPSHTHTQRALHTLSGLRTYTLMNRLAACLKALAVSPALHARVLPNWFHAFRVSHGQGLLAAGCMLGYAATTLPLRCHTAWTCLRSKRVDHVVLDAPTPPHALSSPTRHKRREHTCRELNGNRGQAVGSSDLTLTLDYSTSA